MNRQRPYVWLMIAMLMLLPSAPAFARTIVLGMQDVQCAAAIAESAPRASWAGVEESPGVFNMTAVALQQGQAMLIRYNLDRIPEGMRITRAEWILPVEKVTGQPRLYAWRLQQSWGPGVCYDLRSATPEAQPWSVAGARGGASDRATRPTGVVRMTEAAEHVINVTEDVELWHAGAAPNHGWLLTVEDQGQMAQLVSPLWKNTDAWQLRVTYEPQ